LGISLNTIDIVIDIMGV